MQFLGWQRFLLRWHPGYSCWPFTSCCYFTSNPTQFVGCQYSCLGGTSYMVVGPVHLPLPCCYFPMLWLFYNRPALLGQMWSFARAGCGRHPGVGHGDAGAALHLSHQWGDCSDPWNLQRAVPGHLYVLTGNPYHLDPTPCCARSSTCSTFYK